jgi:hypothetical protein
LLACQLLVGHVEHSETAVTSQYRFHENVVSVLANSYMLFNSANTFEFVELNILTYFSYREYMFFGDVRPCSLVKIDQSFGRNYYLHLQGRRTIFKSNVTNLRLVASSIFGRSVFDSNKGRVVNTYATYSGGPEFKYGRRDWIFLL